MDNSKISFADWALEEALKQGAQAARVELSCIDNLTVQCEDTEITSLQQSNGCGLMLRLFVDGRYGTFSTNRLEMEDVRNLIRNGITCTRLLTPDEARTLPDPSRYYKAHNLEQNLQEMLSLDNFRESNAAINPVSLACEVARPVLGIDNRLIHLSTHLVSRSGWQYMADSQSFRGYSCCSNVGAFSTANMQDEGDCRPSDSWMEYSTCLDELQPLIPELGKKALLAAQHRIGATTIPTGKYHVAVEPVCLMKLLSPILDALQDCNLYQKRTPLLKYRPGDLITAPMLTITEEPQKRGAFSACLFDYEGVRTSQTPIIESGKFRQWFIGTYYGHKLNMPPTLSGPNVLSINPGNQSRAEVMEQLENTILITGFLGGNCNDVTGDFSFGIEGQLYHYGNRVQGIAGMNLTGNILEFWKNLSHICNDVERIPDGYFPTLFFEDIQIQ